MPYTANLTGPGWVVGPITPEQPPYAPGPGYTKSLTGLGWLVDPIPPKSGLTLSPPSAFGYTPSFTVLKAGSIYSTNFLMATVKPTVTHTLYVGAGGDNAATGLTWALRLRSLKQAITKANALGSSSSVIQILVQAGEYRFSSVDGGAIQDSFAGNPLYRKVVIEPCDGSGNVLPLSNTSSRIRSIQDQAMPAFVSVGSSVYCSTYTTENPSYGAWDSSNLNSKGNPQALRNAPPASSYANEAAIIVGVNAQAALYGHGAVWLDTVNKKFYIQTFNNRAPDTSITVGRGNPGDTGSSAANLRPGGMFGATQQVWARNVDFWGGVPLYAYCYVPDGNIFQGWFSDCSFCYGSFNGGTTDNAFNVTWLRCVFDDNYKDGVNYDMSLGAGVGYFHEIDCSMDWNGNDNQGDGSSNASSAHVSSVGVRVNSRATRTQNRAFHDINAVKSWNLGCAATNCRQTGAQSAAFTSGFLPNTGETTQLWLDGCASSGSTYDLQTYKGGQIHAANMAMTGYNNLVGTGGGVIDTYNSPPVVPGAPGALSAAAIDSASVQLTFANSSGASSHQYRINSGSAVTLAGNKIVAGLTQNTAYTFEVRGVNADGFGAWSNLANATTLVSVTPTNILVNGDFAAGTASWSGFGFSGKSVSGGAATFASTPAFDGIQQTIAPVVGKYYDITYTLVRTAGDVTPRFIGGTTVSGAARAASGTFTDRVQAVAGNNALQFINGSVFTATIDDVSVTGPYDTP